MPDAALLPKSPALETPRLILRAFREDDAEAVVSILRNARCAETYLLPDYPTPEDAMPLFGRLRRLSLDPDRFVYAVTRKEAGGADRLLGFLNEQTREGGAVEIGYVLHPDFWNRGYMTEAVGAVIPELFRMGAPAVRAGHFEENASSRRVMEKNGMEPIPLTEKIKYRGKVHRVLYREITREAFLSRGRGKAPGEEAPRRG